MTYRDYSHAQLGYVKTLYMLYHWLYKNNPVSALHGLIELLSPEPLYSWFIMNESLFHALHPKNPVVNRI